MVKSGNIDNFFGTTSYDTTVVNRCLPTTLADLFDYAMYQTADFPQKFKDDPDKFNDHLRQGLFKLPAYQALQNQWVNSTETYTIYTTFNESKYVMKYTSDPIAPAEGHTEDDAWEVVASLFDDAVNYPNALGKAIGELPNDVQSGDQSDAALIAVRMTLTLIAEHHPSLTKLCLERMDAVVNSAGASKDNARYWLPMDTRSHPQHA